MNIKVATQDYTPQTYKKLEKIEAGLARARSLIRKAAKNHNLTQDDPDFVPQGTIYRNSNSFHRYRIQFLLLIFFFF